MTDAQKFHELTGLKLPENYNAADILSRMKDFCGEESFALFMAQLNIISDYERLHIIPFLEHKKAETDEAVLTFAQDKDGTVYLLDCEHKKQEGEI